LRWQDLLERLQFLGSQYPLDGIYYEKECNDESSLHKLVRFEYYSVLVLFYLELDLIIFLVSWFPFLKVSFFNVYRNIRELSDI